MNTFFFVELLQQAGIWGYLLLFLSLFMLSISLVLTHIPLKWLGKIPTILHGIFLLPFLMLILAIWVEYSSMNEILLELKSGPSDLPGLEARATHIILNVYLMLGLYSLMPFWLAFRSVMAFITIQKEKKWRAGFTGFIPSMGAWLLACIFMIVIWSVSNTEGYGIGISIVLLVNFAIIVPFSSLTQDEEDGDKLAFFSNYLSILSAWVLFLCTWAYEWTLRLKGVEYAIQYNETIEITKPFSETGQAFVGLMCVVLFVILFYYSMMMKSQKVQAIALTLITAMVFAGTYLVGARAEGVLDRHQVSQRIIPEGAQNETSTKEL
jgi:hypothetical protein